MSMLSSAVAFRAPRKAHVAGLALGARRSLPRERDLRAGRRWWMVEDQPDASASLALAANAVIRWHLVESGRLATHERLAPAFLELASDLVGYGDHTRRRLRALLEAARRFGCVREADLAVDSNPNDTHRLLFARAARYRIAAYISLGAEEFHTWRRWLVAFGPILTWLHVDPAWRDATRTRGLLDRYDSSNSGAAQAVTIVGYRSDGRLIVRNSWGLAWGDAGHAYVSEAYARAALMEAYGLAV